MKEFQFGWLIFIFVVPAQLLMTYLYFNNIGDTPVGTTGFLVFSLVIILTYLLFYGMTTWVSNDAVKVSFGIGLIRKTIPLSRVTSVKTVKNPWYYGWGIRFIPNGMLYNIHGLDGIELLFKDTGKVVRIGSKDSSKLMQEVEKRASRK